jgi:hypothetical protein
VVGASIKVVEPGHTQAASKSFVSYTVSGWVALNRYYIGEMSLSSTVSVLDLLPSLPGYRAKDPFPSPKRPILFEIHGGSMMVKDRDDVLPAINNGSVVIDDSTCLSTIGSQGRLNKTFSRSPMRTNMNIEPITLTFDAFFEEVPAFGPEAGRLRTRFCKIFYYCSEFKLKVVENKSANSGMSQGVLVRKSYVLKPDGCPFMDEDLRVGEVLPIYGREYVLTGCDEFTKNYFQQRGIYFEPSFDDDYGGAFDKPLSPSQTMSNSLSSTSLAPEDWAKYRSKRNNNKTYMEAMMGNTVNNTGREGYNKYGNMTLVFQCVWDNTHTLYGDRLKYTLKYYLSDDTIEIFSIPTPEIKEQFSRLLKRGKLPKEAAFMQSINEASASEFYHWREIQIGSNIGIYGRNLRIINADKKTREFYRANGMFQGSGESDPVPLVAHHAREIPPPTGFGSEEDSIRSCQGSLLPNPPRAKKLGEDRKLCFFGKLLSGTVDDHARRFVITYYVMDDTIKVQEPPIRNSGFGGGVFLSRRAIKSENDETIMPQDLYVGCKLQLLKHRFLLYEANEGTLRWMEDKMFPQSNFYEILSKIRPCLMDSALNGTLHAQFAKFAPKGLESGMTTKEGLQRVLEVYGLSGDMTADHLVVNEHQLLTMVRANGNKHHYFSYVKLIEQIIAPTDEFL